MTRTRALIFDLDDTLIDTYGLLITPLERRAAELIGAIDDLSLGADHILQFLLALRRKYPGQLYSELAKLAPEHTEIVIQAHKQVFANFSIEALEMAATVTEMLKTLSQMHKLVLLTEGDFDVQRAKIRHLSLDAFFSDILVVDPKRGDSKRSSISRFMDNTGFGPEDLVVIGNRLDNEIAAATSLGIRSIWVRAGEGSEMVGAEDVDAIVARVTDVPHVLQRWGSE